jgi:hypothetical protein
LFLADNICRTPLRTLDLRTIDQQYQSNVA